MPSNRRPTLRRVSWAATTTAVVLVLMAWNGGSEPVAAAPRRGYAGVGGSCPLSGAQQVNAAKAWQKMMPVFRSPRCTNCHGGVDDPLASKEPASHMGVVEMSSADPASTCQDCHMDGWRLAPNWTQKNDPELCSDMKMRFSSEQFIDHIVRDGGGVPFIEAGFKGMRGLTDGGISIAEGEDHPVTPEPPPGTHSQLVQQAKDWVKAQGGRFVGDNDCGCALDKMEVKIRSTLTVLQNGKLKGKNTITGEGSKTLVLGPDVSEPDFFATSGTGTFTAPISWSGVSVDRGNGCVVTVQASPATEAIFWIAIAVAPTTRVSLEFVPGTDLHSVQTKCRNPATGRWVTGMPNEKEPGVFSAPWIALHGQAAATSTAPPMNLASMDMAKLQAMAEKMKGATPSAATGAQIGEMMNQVLPNGNAMMEAARNNFKFAMPSEWCKPDSTYVAKCEINRTITVPTNLGWTQTITENTVITIGRP